MKKTIRSSLRHIGSLNVLCVVILLSGCASTGTQDPYEKYNRKMFVFNSVVDRAVFRPVAKAYDTVTPAPVQKGVTNFFDNLAQPIVIANDLLQLNMEWFVSDIGRLIVNTTLGIGGLIDVASAVNIEKHTQDFGLTLAKWGVKESPYLIVPFLPPTTPRDLIGTGMDYFGGLSLYVDLGGLEYALLGLDLINERAAVLPADKLIEQSFDPYVFVRDAYLERRESQVQRVLRPHVDPNALNSETDFFQPTDALESAPRQEVMH